MNHLQGQIGELRLTVDITRAATGKTETYELVGSVMDDEDGAVEQAVPATLAASIDHSPDGTSA